MRQQIRESKRSGMVWRVLMGGFVLALSAILAGCGVLEGRVPGMPAPQSTGENSRVAIRGGVLWGDLPVAAAQIELRTGAWADPAASQVVVHAVADADGNYSLSVPEGVTDCALVARWPDGAANFAPVTPIQMPQPGDSLQMDLHLARELTWLEPASGEQTGTTPTLRWETIQEAETYQVWVIDTASTELVFDLHTGAAAEATQSLVLPPLTPDRNYTCEVQAFDAEKRLLAGYKGEFYVAAESGKVSGELPPACTLSGDPVHVDRENGFCFPYPERFEVGADEAGRLVVYGPALDESAEPLRARLVVEVEPSAADAVLAEIVDDYVAQFAGLPTPTISRRQMTLAVQPAEYLEDVPGREGSIDVWMLGNGSLFHLMFMPSVRDYPQAQADVAELFALVTGSFSLLPLDGGQSARIPSVSGEPIYAPVTIDQLGLSAEVPAGWLRLEPGWVWAPADNSEIRLGVRWVDLAPPQEIEAAMLPGNSIVLSNQPSDVEWGSGNMVTVAVYGPDAEITAVEAHALFAVQQEGKRWALDVYTVSPDEAQQIAVQPVLQHALDTLSGPSL